MHIFESYKGIWLIVQNFVLPYLTISLMKIRNFHRYGFLKSYPPNDAIVSQLFLTQLLEFVFDKPLTALRLVCKINLLKTYPFTYIWIGIWSRFRDTDMIITSRCRGYARDLRNPVEILPNVRFATLGNSKGNFSFVVYQNQFIHITMKFKHVVTVYRETKSTDGLLGADLSSQCLRVCSPDAR